MKEVKQIKVNIRVGYVVKAKVVDVEETKRDGRSSRMSKELMCCVQAVV